ncbi:hypothetical protein [Haloplanus aerogenes]|uniref:Uncharacterized protein n=1 Tax=Haloplanus aerogenes TaxID=660522 RepID=A0A3M0DQB2_9EURY|nr:hypothetical protein [Haloplanus aerogenes]AZH24426.1 hypothetical protein DU502_03100 [Haloplanus aerogenes]RMB23931.1 hypothetical protein ATH50_1161 [Haloplanus aerogenes]
MKFKPVPPAPEKFAYVERVQQAVPLVPGTEDDCCARLVDRLDLPSRDAARTWLTFLRALELAEETPSGYRRTDREPTVSACRETLLNRVFAAEAVHETLAEAGPLTAAEAFDRVRERVPAWERHRDAEWTDTWRERVTRLLDWLVLLDVTERVERDGATRYRLT